MLEVGAAALRAGEQGAAHRPAAGADDVGGLTAVERRLGRSEVADHTHQEGGGARGLRHGAVVLPQHPSIILHLSLLQAITLTITSLWLLFHLGVLV